MSVTDVFEFFLSFNIKRLPWPNWLSVNGVHSALQLSPDQSLSEVVNHSFLMIAHHAVDMLEELLDKIPQSAQVLTSVSLSFSSFSLSPSHCFVQPKLHLLDSYQMICSVSNLGLLLQLRHPAAWLEHILKCEKVKDNC